MNICEINKGIKQFALGTRPLCSQERITALQNQDKQQTVLRLHRLIIHCESTSAYRGLYIYKIHKDTHTYSRLQIPTCTYRLFSVTLHSYKLAKTRSVDREARPSGFLWHLLSDTSRAWQMHWTPRWHHETDWIRCQIEVNNWMVLQGTQKLAQIGLIQVHLIGKWVFFSSPSALIF